MCPGRHNLQTDQDKTDNYTETAVSTFIPWPCSWEMLDFQSDFTGRAFQLFRLLFYLSCKEANKLNRTETPAPCFIYAFKTKCILYKYIYIYIHRYQSICCPNSTARTLCDQTELLDGPFVFILGKPISEAAAFYRNVLPHPWCWCRKEHQKPIWQSELCKYIFVL